jgi:hypothetical protein
MSEIDSHAFVKIGNVYYPAQAIHFEVSDYSGSVTIYKLGTHEVLCHITGAQAKTLIINLNAVSLPLLPE